VGRELTKAYEELVVWPIYKHLQYFIAPKGEFTVLVPPAAPAGGPGRPTPSEAQLRLELGVLTNNEALTRRKALKVLADRHGMAVNELYRLLDDARNGGHIT
jgi:16S rRNA C1402 (ribose-2'-O) methylase RsmI